MRVSHGLFSESEVVKFNSFLFFEDFFCRNDLETYFAGIILWMVGKLIEINTKNFYLNVFFVNFE